MELGVCLVCLKTFDGVDPASEEKDRIHGTPSSVPLLTRFLKFTENYLNLSSPTTHQLLSSEGVRKEAFCERCEVSVINPICQVYLELLSAQLRLSSELENLGKLLDNSKVSGSDKSRVLNINTLSNQLDIRSLSQLEGFRTSLSQKCYLKRKHALPNVILTSRCDKEQTGIIEKDESHFHCNLKAVKVETQNLQASDDNTLDLEPFRENVISLERNNEERETIRIDTVPMEPVMKCETFYQDSNSDELIFENGNNGEIEESPPEQSELAAIPVAEHEVTRINGKLYNGRRCPKCSIVLKDESQYQIHYRYYHLPVPCNICGKTFSKQKSLRQHFRLCHQKRGIFTCQVCSKVFETAHRLKAHVHKAHTHNDRPTGYNVLDLQPDGLSSTDAGEEVLSERISTGPAKNLNTIHFHQLSNPELIFENENDEEIEDLPGSGLSELEVIPVAEVGEIRVNGEVDNGSGHCCPKCSKVLKDKTQYYNHYNHHHQIRSCKYCREKFVGRKSLRQHFRVCHQKPEIHTCQLCLKVFGTAPSLRDHINKTHREATCHCPHCDYSSKSQPMLKQHILAIHKPGKFICPHCPKMKVFATSLYLRYHIKRKHPQFLVKGESLEKTQHTTVQLA
ncbi:unnamed protein product [Orchesella dallaii]|uniref:C2H2-type domain-containing protein n=1 Tax=Orchesella dallaii TaxID=48710 RepID=A0ABP1SBA8_9HEXA